MEITWHYLINQFLNATERNYKKALKLSNYHDAALKKAMDDSPMDPDFALLYNRYHPLHLAYVDVYNDWKNAGGQQEGQTLNVDQLLKLLVTKVNLWDAQVQAVFEKGTPTYKTIFPDGHAPFISGDKISRIMAVNTLGTALTGHAALAATKTLVDGFYTTLDGARDVQEASKGTVKALSQGVNNNRVMIMVMQYRNLGFFIDKVGETPLFIESFYELQILRDHVQGLFTGTLEPAENEAVLIHTFVSDDKIRIKLTGTGEAKFYLASSTNGTNSTPITINVVGTFEQIYEASVFAPADYGTHRFLTAVNNNVGAGDLLYEIELL